MIARLLAWLPRHTNILNALIVPAGSIPSESPAGHPCCIQTDADIAQILGRLK